MGSSAQTEYCAFTKAVEHLGDRWSLLIVRELAQFGPQGFNTLATGLPGRVSRSVLAAKLHKLEEIGLLARDPSVPGRSAPYCLTPAGEQLLPTLKSLWDWAEHWIPEDPAMAGRDPSVILWWLRHRVDRGAAPVQQVAIEIDMREARPDRTWLLLARDAEPNVCLEDPMLGDERYVYVEAGADDLLPVARGQRTWAEAIGDGSVTAYGPPELVSAMTGWFAAPS
ncbi:MAG TPA: helix-turn-helix domain-containing protein [Candidatus Limnocylindria bacterium]